METHMTFMANVLAMVGNSSEGKGRQEHDRQDEQHLDR